MSVHIRIIMHTPRVYIVPVKLSEYIFIIFVTRFYGFIQNVGAVLKVWCTIKLIKMFVFFFCTFNIVVYNGSGSLSRPGSPHSIGQIIYKMPVNRRCYFGL